MAQKEAEAFLTESARIIKKGDLRKVLTNKGKIKKKIKIVGSCIDDVDTKITLIGDYASGEYERVPLWTIASVCAALLYFLNPLDLIPDSTPITGYMDDAAIVSACLMMVGNNLNKYRKWKKRHS